MTQSQELVATWRDPAARSVMTAPRRARAKSPVGQLEFSTQKRRGRALDITASTLLTTCEACCGTD